MNRFRLLVMLAAAAGLAVSASDHTGQSLKMFEPAADEPYRLGAGDEITVEVLARPELSGKHVIGPDGRISVPVAGEVALAGLTREDGAGRLATTLGKFYQDPSVQVRVDKYGSNRILVLGKVARPGVIYFEGVPTLLEVMTKAGAASGESKPQALPVRCAIFRGPEQVAWIRLREMVEGGQTLANLRLQRDDVVYVPADQDEIVSVLGHVNHPGAITLERNSTLLSVLAQAGGLKEDAKASQIQILRAKDGKVIEVALRNFLSGTANVEFVLAAGDVIYVPETGFSKAARVLEKLSPITSMAMIGAIAAR